MNDQNRQIVEAYYRALYSPGCDAAIARYLADDYKEHQYTAGFTKAGLGAYVTRRLRAFPAHAIVIHHVLGEGDFIFLFVQEHLDHNLDVARAELFRLIDGTIAEHWGTCVVDEPRRKNGNGTFDGRQVDRGVDYARRFAARFEALDLQGFNEQQLDTFYESRTADYRQHSPKGADGLVGLVDILAQMQRSGITMTMAPKRVLADGDFLVCHRFYDSAPKHPLVNRINTFDMFRINADGKAVEHWDVMEDIPAQQALAPLF